MAEILSASSPVTCSRVVIGIPREPNATGAVLAINARPEACKGRKPSWISNCAGDCHRSAESGHALDECAERKRNEDHLTRGLGVTDARLSRSTLKRPRLTVSWYRKMTLRMIQPIGE